MLNIVLFVQDKHAKYKKKGEQNYDLTSTCLG